VLSQYGLGSAGSFFFSGCLLIASRLDDFVISHLCSSSRDRMSIVLSLSSRTIGKMKLDALQLKSPVPVAAFPVDAPQSAFALE